MKNAGEILRDAYLALRADAELKIDDKIDIGWSLINARNHIDGLEMLAAGGRVRKLDPWHCAVFSGGAR